VVGKTGQAVGQTLKELSDLIKLSKTELADGIRPEEVAQQHIGRIIRADKTSEKPTR